MHTVLPRTNHLPASLLFEIKLFNLTVFSSAFFFYYFMHLPEVTVNNNDLDYQPRAATAI